MTATIRTAAEFLAAAVERGTLRKIRTWPSGMVLVEAKVDGETRKIRVHPSQLLDKVCAR